MKTEPTAAPLAGVGAPQAPGTASPPASAGPGARVKALAPGRGGMLRLSLSVVAGLVLGYALGARTGVRPALEAGARVDAVSLAQALPWKAEIASEPAERRQIARLLEEVRVNRARIEALRHATETARIGERVKALETARDAATEAARAQERRSAQLGADLARVGDRLGALERRAVDMTPTATISLPERKRPDAKSRP